MSGHLFDFVLVRFGVRLFDKAKVRIIVLFRFFGTVFWGTFYNANSTRERVLFGTLVAGPENSLHRFFRAGQNYELCFEAVYRACF